MSIIREVLRALGFSIHVRRTGLAHRIRNLATLVIVLISAGTAVGYAIATRGLDPIDDAADGDGE